VLYTDVIFTSEVTVQLSLFIIEHHTIKSNEKMQAGLHAFQTGQYEHDGLLLTPCTCLQRACLRHRTTQEPLMSNLKLVEHLKSNTDSEQELLQ